MGITEAEITRRGFIVLAATAGASFFIKPGLLEALAPEKTYLMSVGTIGYGHLWDKEAEGDPELMAFFEPSEAELRRESLVAGSVLHFWRDPELDEDECWLDVVSDDGVKICDIPWSSTPEERAAIMRATSMINEGREVWAEVADVRHRTIDAMEQNARIHEIEFDVFYR